jgi:hypothetical protein
MDNKLHTINETCYLIFNEGHGWELWSMHPDSFLYWKDVIRTENLHHPTWDFKILVELDRK